MDQRDRHLVRAGHHADRRTRGRPGARARPGDGALRRPEAGGALAVLDARGDGLLHLLRPLALVGERLMVPFAHAGHWLAQIAYLLLLIGALVWGRVKERRAKRDE